MVMHSSTKLTLLWTLRSQNHSLFPKISSPEEPAARAFKFPIGLSYDCTGCWDQACMGSLPDTGTAVLSAVLLPEDLGRS